MSKPKKAKNLFRFIAFILVTAGIVTLISEYDSIGFSGRSTAAAADDSEASEGIEFKTGWSINAGLLPYYGVPNTAALTINLYDQNEQPISDASITVFVSETKDSEILGMLRLEEDSDSKGFYATPIEFPKDGDWYFRIMAVKDKNGFSDEKLLTVKFSTNSDEW